MSSFRSFASDSEEPVHADVEGFAGAGENSPLLESNNEETTPKEKWKPGSGFLWIEIGRLRKAIRYRVLVLTYIKQPFLPTSFFQALMEPLQPQHTL